MPPQGGPAGGAAGTERVGVAAFDFDGTLISGDSLVRFLGLVAGRRRVGRAFMASGPSLVATLRSGNVRDTTKALVLARLLAGSRADALSQAGERYAEQLERRIRPAMATRLAWHRDQGHLVVMVSASLTAYLSPLGRRLGFDGVLATQLEVGGDGLLTGRLLGANVRGREKEARLRTWLAGAVAGADWELWAYGDSAGDRELLAMADHPTRL